jgi:transcriptional regulator with XRE-family HTH domain
MWGDVVPRRARGDDAVDSAKDPVSNHQLLDTWMSERRRKLGIKTWTELAERAGMSDENLRKIRRGEISISENAADGIEDALQWERGSVEAAAHKGIKPTLRGNESARAATSAGWTAEMEAFYQILKAKFHAEGLEMNEAIDQLRIELPRRAARQERIPNDSR